ncbi:glycoside hydrolase family 3 N-terminal domain-containing protein [Glutamicibacter uratoxydans]|uniref:glycoside hydrolase family 3 N-terminal domain-containing protein n=1 Tax=Glutamicibacter uratoxydans TaxID=43667 RepID=UPI003D6EB1A5
MNLRRSARVLAPLLALSLIGCAVDAPLPSETTRPSESGDSSSRNPGPSTTPTPTPEPADVAAELVNEMDQRQQAALLVMAGLPATGATQRQLQALAEAGINSVFLRGRSQKSLTATRAVVDEITAELEGNLPENYPVWVATDQEGGFVRVLQGAGFSELPTAVEQGGWSESRLQETIEVVGAELAEAGININLAPVADTVPQQTAGSNAPIGYWKRNYAFEPVPVSMAVRQVNESFYAAGVQPVVKHFPGLGRVKANTDTAANVIDAQTTTQDEYLLPFADSITQDVAWVMISNASYPELDEEHLAPFSEAIITDLLRTELGYDRLVISDDLCDAVAVSKLDVGQRAVQFIEAGGTLALCVQSGPAVQMVQALIDQAEADSEFAQKVRQAATVVMTERLLAAEQD